MTNALNPLNTGKIEGHKKREGHNPSHSLLGSIISVVGKSTVEIMGRFLV